VFTSAICPVYGQGDSDFMYFFCQILPFILTNPTFGPFQKLCPNLASRVGAREEGSQHVQFSAICTGAEPSWPDSENSFLEWPDVGLVWPKGQIFFKNTPSVLKRSTQLCLDTHVSRRVLVCRYI
jgi:hypothetical protein